VKNWTIIAKNNLSLIDRSKIRFIVPWFCWQSCTKHIHLLRSNTISMSVVSELSHERPNLELSKKRKLIVVTTKYQLISSLVPTIHVFFSQRSLPFCFPSPIPPSFLLNIYTLLNELDLLFAMNMNEIFTGEH